MTKPRCPGSPRFFLSGGGGGGSFVVLAQVGSKEEGNRKLFREFCTGLGAESRVLRGFLGPRLITLTLKILIKT